MVYMEKDKLASAGESEFPATEDDDPFDGVGEE